MGRAVPSVVVYHPTVTYRSGWSMYWTIRLGLFAVFALVSLGGWIYHRATGKQIAGVTDVDDDDDDWSGAAPLTCGGNDDLNLTGVKATFTSGAAITAGGNCKVTCKNCTLKAPIGVQAGGNASIILIGGSVEGDQSIVAAANSKVDVKGDTKVTGPVDKSGNATITGVAAPAASASVAAVHPTAAAPSHSAHAPPPPGKPAGKKK